MSILVVGCLAFLQLAVNSATALLLRAIQHYQLVKDKSESISAARAQCLLGLADQQVLCGFGRRLNTCNSRTCSEGLSNSSQLEVMLPPDAVCENLDSSFLVHAGTLCKKHRAASQ